MNTYKEDPAGIPVRENVDVVVLGEGTDAVCAAVAAARGGASTVLVNRLAIFGGRLTSGACPYIRNRLFKDGKRILEGLPVEIIERLVVEGGAPRVVIDAGTNISEFMVDPEILGVILTKMCADAGVRMHLLSVFCETIIDHGRPSGVVLQSKAGRYAVLAKEIIDATRYGAVAASAGAKYVDGDDFENASYGLCARIGHVNTDKFIDFFTKRRWVADNNAEFNAWLCKKTGYSLDVLKNDKYYRRFVYPLSPDSMVLRDIHSKSFSSVVREMYNRDGNFFRIGIHFFGDLLMRADKNGDLDFEPRDGGITLRFNPDGFSAGKWRCGEVVANLVCTKENFFGADSKSLFHIERAARRRILDISYMLKKYLPGFENSYLITVGTETLPPSSRRFETISDFLEKNRRYSDEIFTAELDGEITGIPLALFCPECVESMIVTRAGVGVRRELGDALYLAAAGQGVGIAAAIAAKDNCIIRNISVKKLKTELLKQTVVIDSHEARNENLL